MLDGYDYTNWLEKEEPSATKLKIEKEEEPVDIVAIPLLGDNKKGKRRNINGNLNSKQTITRLPLLAALIKSGNISWNLKNQIRQILYFLYRHNKITKKLYKNF